MKKYTIPSLILAAFMLVASSCHHDDDNDDTRVPYVVPDSLMRTLKIDTVKVRNITDEIKFNGLVNFNTDKVVTVYPLITGNLQGVNVVPGDYVHKGQTLGVVMSAEIANYNSALITAETNVRLTKRQLDQQQEMFKSGLASQVDLTNAQVAYEQAVAAKIAASKIMSINGNNKNGEYDIKSPIDGFIVQMNVSNGTAIRSDNNIGLFTISDLKNVWVEANVYEANIGKVKQGDTVQVTTISYPDKVFNGRVDKIMNVLDPSTKTMKMRVVLNNPDYLLKPQMFATVRLNHNETSKAVSVSSKALVFDNSQYYVIVITGKKNVAIRPVQVAGNNGDVAYIKSGLAPGERVVASNALLIYGSLNN